MVDKTLRGRPNSSHREDTDNYVVTHALRGEGFDASEDGTGRGTPMVPVAVPYDLFQITAPLNRQSRKDGDPCHTLARDNAAHAAVVTQVGVDLYNHSETGDVAATILANSGGTDTAGPKVLSFKPNQSASARGLGISEHTSPTPEGAGGGNNKPAVVSFGWQNSPSRGMSFSDHLAPTLDKSKTPAVVTQAVAFQACGDRDDPGLSVSEQVAFTIPANPMSDRGQAVAHRMRVRRLMPVECERLQGFPDGWTLITYRGKPAADGPRYKAIGNSMAVPVMAWIGRRLRDRM